MTVFKLAHRSLLLLHNKFILALDNLLVGRNEIEVKPWCRYNNMRLIWIPINVFWLNLVGHQFALVKEPIISKASRHDRAEQRIGLNRYAASAINDAEQKQWNLIENSTRPS